MSVLHVTSMALKVPVVYETKLFIMHLACFDYVKTQLYMAHCGHPSDAPEGVKHYI